MTYEDSPPDPGAVGAGGLRSDRESQVATESRVKRVRVYVDGFNLYYGMHTAFGRQYVWLDLEALATGLLLPGERLDRVGYFTARMRADVGSRHRQDLYLQALAARSTCLAIAEGRFQQKSQLCRSCASRSAGRIAERVPSG